MKEKFDKKVVLFETIESEILDHFDFANVYKVMQFLEWKWFDAASADGSGVPELHEIRKKARYLLRQAANKLLLEKELPEFTVATGGLKATAYRDSNADTIYFQLEFVVEDWSNLD